jgi:hypothetical protein
MPRTHEDHALGDFKAAVNFTGHAPRINVTGMWHEAGPSTDFLFFDASYKIGIDGCAQALRIIWIKASGDGGWANHGEP